MTLPSNASMAYYPKNTMANYVTQLYQPLELEGAYDVAMCEVSLPPILNTNNCSGVLELRKHGDKEASKHAVIRSEDCVGDTLETLLRRLDSILVKLYELHSIPVPKDKDGALQPHLEIKDGRVELTGFMRPEVSLVIKGNLAILLGFPLLSHNPPLSVELKPNKFMSHTGSVLQDDVPRAIKPLPDTIFVYTDIIEHQYIGDSFKQLLRTVHINDLRKDSFAKTYTIYESPHYVPLLALKAISSIRITIKDSAGELVSFKSGTDKVIVKLHFRRKNGL